MEETPKQSEEGAATTAEQPNEPASGLADQVKPTSFSFYANYDWFTAGNWGEDVSSMWVKDNLGIEVTMVQSSGAAESKLNTMIASNSLPDVIMLDRGADVERLRQAGVILPLDEYFDKYPNFKKEAGEDTLNMLRSSDGKLYQMPDWYTKTANGNSGWIVNKKIYKELGSPKLETYDDLEAYLKLVKEKFPDIIPLEVGTLAQGVNIMYGGFKEESPYPRQLAYVDGNQLKSIYEDPQYKETMLYANRLFREKLITQDALTQTDDMVKEKLKTGRVAVYVAGDIANYGFQANMVLQQVDPEAGYDYIWPIHKTGLDATKIKTASYSSLGWNVVVITKNAKDPEAIFSYLDWLTGQEGQRTMFFGPPGLYWDEIDASGFPKFNEKGKSVESTERDKILTNTHNWVGNSEFTRAAKIHLNSLLPVEQQNWTTNAQANVTFKTTKNGTEFEFLNPLPESEEGIILTAIKDLNTEVFAKMLFAKNDEEVEALLASAHNDAMKIGYDKLLTHWTKRWQENLGKMGKN